MRLLLPFFLFAISLHAYAQTSYTLSGHIQDAGSGEQLIGATIYDEDTRLGVASNIYGFYSFTLPEGKHTVVVTYIGYTAQKFEVDLSKNLSMDINLVAGTELKEAIVTGESYNKIEDQVQMSKVEIPIDQIKRLPAIGGEVDLLKALQLMPGVQSGGEGSSGLYVRGGSPDQNLILLDGVPLYNVSHLFGFFSVFNADAVRNISITKGGFPARYGGRLSSIVDIHMKDGDMNDYHADGTISLLSSKLTFEGPIVSDRASFMISGRRTYLDLLLAPLLQNVTSKDQNTDITPRYFFYDLNAKLNWKISPKDRVYFSFFNGLDDFGLKFSENFRDQATRFDIGLNWGNKIQSLRWNHEWSPRLFSNLSLITSKYNFTTGADATYRDGNDEARFVALYVSQVDDIGAKIDFDFSPNSRHYIRYGINYTNHTFLPGVDSTLATASLGGSPPEVIYSSSGGAIETKSDEIFAYFEDEFEASDKLKLNLGVHSAILFVDDTSYVSFQPRISLNYKLFNDIALKFSYAKMSQFVNLLSNEGVGQLPTDLWVPTTRNVRPQLSRQVAFGVAKTFRNIEFSLEGYYKALDGVLSYREGTDFMFSADSSWESQVTQGIGNSYGFEILLQKKKGKTSGWIGYTLSWSNRQFDDINSGLWYPFTYDRRHDMSFVCNHEINDFWDLGLVFVYGTGRALTLTESSFETYVLDPSGANIIPITGEVPSSKNAYRLSPYHRLDISLTNSKLQAAGQRDWIFSAYNVYNNVNPFYARITEDPEGNTVIEEFGLFPIIPSIAWRYKF